MKQPRTGRPLLLLAALATCAFARLTELVADDGVRYQTDVCIYGGTSGGVVAAVQTARMYVREDRRMVSDLVLTEHHTFGRQIAPHSIGLGSYGTDVHEIRRIMKDGVVAREGKVAAGRGGAGPYPIGYGAIVPRAEECENLFVTFALSASHTAFASIRMEPVFMVTSQSAATAACWRRTTPCRFSEWIMSGCEAV